MTIICLKGKVLGDCGFEILQPKNKNTPSPRNKSILYQKPFKFSVMAEN
jgi:hypothetical protein